MIFPLIFRIIHWFNLSQVKKHSEIQLFTGDHTRAPPAMRFGSWWLNDSSLSQLSWTRSQTHPASVSTDVGAQHQKRSAEQSVPDRNPGQRNKVKHQFYFPNIKTLPWQLVVFHRVAPARTVVNFIYQTARSKCTICFWVAILELKALWCRPLTINIQSRHFKALLIEDKNTQSDTLIYFTS